VKLGKLFVFVDRYGQTMTRNLALSSAGEEGKPQPYTKLKFHNNLSKFSACVLGVGFVKKDIADKHASRSVHQIYCGGRRLGVILQIRRQTPSHLLGSKRYHDSGNGRTI
jgi:hypothetical protein